MEKCKLGLNTTPINLLTPYMNFLLIIQQSNEELKKVTTEQKLATLHLLAKMFQCSNLLFSDLLSQINHEH